MPSSPRFPLFADEVPPAYSPAEAPAAGRPRRAWLPWVAAAAVVVLLAALGVALVGGGDSGSADSQRRDGRSTQQPRPSTPKSSAPAGIAAGARVEVPATAPPNQDVQGNPVSYGAGQLVDGIPETCWRMPGDGTGDTITVRLAQRTHLDRVGLINGYAKMAKDAQGRDLDWYHGNRRVLAVEWTFDDGSTVSQRLGDTEAVQSVDVDVTTRSVRLRLVSVSPPGKGPAARNYTALSEIALVGTAR